MSKWAIVAIPSADDYVWKLSSEKVPHLTLLYLGDHEMGPETSKIETFVEHAAKMSLNSFGLSVDRRGLLGEDDADVLFFNGRSAKNLEQFRHFLLTNEAISSAYNSVEQFPTWTPHLTLGFPETPAKPDSRDYHRVDYVEFDRIAVWFGDYEGPEFLLDPYEFSEDLSMSDSVEEFLSHYGVKGMKWGVRKDGSPGSSSVTSDDAKQAAAAKAKISSGGTKSLSNKELQDLVTRMNLEQQYSRLSSEPGSIDKGKKFIENGLYAGKKTNEIMKFLNSPAGKAAKSLFKKGLLLAL